MGQSCALPTFICHNLRAANALCEIWERKNQVILLLQITLVQLKKKSWMDKNIVIFFVDFFSVESTSNDPALTHLINRSIKVNDPTTVQCKWLGFLCKNLWVRVSVYFVFCSGETYFLLTRQCLSEDLIYSHFSLSRENMMKQQKLLLTEKVQICVADLGLVILQKNPSSYSPS